jgi:Ca2+-binding EF-hand superfamily protein
MYLLLSITNLLPNLSISLYKRNERKEEAEELIEKLDPSKSGLIGFSSYANETFGSAIIEILAVDDHSENLKELKILYGLEKAKWTNLSSTDELLNYDKFYEFLFADESSKLKDLEKEISFRAYDTNNDGFLNIDEFTAAIKGF